jgi:DNA-directed RNA polymerase specialized sigma24 family protein
MKEQLNGTVVFLTILPCVERHARFAFRAMRDAHRVEDCIQETLALCWVWACQLWEKGKDARQFPTTLALFATRHVKHGRRLGGGKRLTKDALSPLAQASRGFLTKALPSIEAETGSPWQAALQDNTQSPPHEQAAFRIDFPAFLATLPDRKRTIAENMMMGETTQELSRRHRLSPGRISQLRRHLLKDWRAFTDDAA